MLGSTRLNSFARFREFSTLPEILLLFFEWVIAPDGVRERLKYLTLPAPYPAATGALRRSITACIFWRACSAISLACGCSSP